MSVAGLTNVDTDMEVFADVIASEKLLSGSADTKVWNAFTDTSGQFHVGHWASGPCKIKVSYTENELCVLTQGIAILTDANGESRTFETGQPFVVQAGFEGTWESVGDVVKIYAIFEASSSAP